MTVDAPGPRRWAWRAHLTRSLLWRSTARFVAITGYDRALGLAAQAFVAAVPTVIVASAVTDRPADTLAGRIISRFQLSGTTADLVRQAFQPPGDQAATVWGACLLVVSGIGFTRALQRAFRAAWGIRQEPGWRAWVGGMGGALTLAAVIAAGAAASTVVTGFQGAGPAVFAVRAFVFGAAWMLAIRLLLGWSLSWRPFLPGAVVAGAGTAAVWLASTVWFSRALRSDVAAYGLMGIVAVLISWLIVVALLLVVAAVVSAELWHSRAALPLAERTAGPHLSRVGDGLDRNGQP